LNYLKKSNKELIDLYNKLYRSKSLDKIREYRLVLLNVILNNDIYESKKPALLFYINNYLNSDFTSKILHSALTKKGIIHPIPKDFNFLLTKSNIKIDKIKCFFSFKYLLLVNILKAIIYFFKLIFANHYLKFNKKDILIHGICENNLPVDSRAYEVSLFSSLSFNYPEKFNNKNFYCSINTSKVYYKIITCGTHLPYLSWNKKITFFLISFKDIMVAIRSIFNNSWEKALLIKQIIEKNWFSLVEKIHLPSTYLIPDNTSIYNPMWINEVEKKGKDVIQFEYSVSNSPSPLSNKFIDLDFLSVRDFKSKVFINKYSKKNYLTLNKKVENTYLIGNYDFETFEPFSHNENEKFILVYNYRVISEDYFGFNYLNDYGYFNLKTNIKFLEDIIEANQSNFKIFLKQKRDFNPNHHNRDFKNFTDELVKKGKIYEVNPKVSNLQISKIASGIISIPLTSTVFLGDKANSIYYDPTGGISKKDPFLYDRKLYNSTQELSKWINKIKCS
jgi:polysaccharide biosynthesis PFTS motif protein